MFCLNSTDNFFFQAKNDALKHGGKAKGRKRNADQNWALSYEEMQEELNRERHKVRTLNEELRQYRCVMLYSEPSHILILTLICTKERTPILVKNRILCC